MWFRNFTPFLVWNWIITEHKLETWRHIQDNIDTSLKIVDKIVDVTFENGRRVVDTNENWTGRILKKSLKKIIYNYGARETSV